MNKSETKKRARAFFLQILFLTAAFFSCERSGAEKEGEAVFSGAGAPVSAEAAETPVPSGGDAGREAILIRGNYWVSGVSGFGPNGFSALSGDYRIGGLPPRPAGARERVFSVHLTRELLYFSGDWQTRPGTGDTRVFEREGEEGFLAALVLDDGGGSSWIAVFRFPGGLEEAGLNAEDFDLMLRAWARRFSYFLSLSKTPDELSLPAALQF